MAGLAAHPTEVSMKHTKSIDRLALAAMIAATTLISAAHHAYAESDAPQARLTLSNGIERSFYTSGPLGTTTYRVDRSKDGLVVDKTQVLTDGVFSTLPYGATEAQVLATIGPPARKEAFRGTHTVAWDYHYRDAWGYDADFAAIFDANGVMVGKFSSRDSG